MKRLLMLVEGQSEEVLSSRLLPLIWRSMGSMCNRLSCCGQSACLAAGVSGAGYRAGIRFARICMGKIGIERVRLACPHFSGWLDRLEMLGQGA